LNESCELEQAVGGILGIAALLRLGQPVMDQMVGSANTSQIRQQQHRYDILTGGLFFWTAHLLEGFPKELTSDDPH
jgi:hypothetical protein